MKSLRIFSRLLVLIPLILFSCHHDKDDEVEIEKYPDLRIYLDRFEEQAAKLGYNFDLSDVEIAYVDKIEDNGVELCGVGGANLNGSVNRRIEISKSCDFLHQTETARDNLVFHELGHAFFNRLHDQTMQCDGRPSSLMFSGNPFNIYDDSDENVRNYYVGELIDPLIALTKCINYATDLDVDSVLYDFNGDAAGWQFQSPDKKYSGNNLDNKLFITSAPGQGTEDGYWFRQFETLSIPECSEVKLRVRLNADQLTGAGASIAIRTFESRVLVNGATSDQKILLSSEDSPGQLDNYTQELTIPCYSRKMSAIVAFVALKAGTQGKVKFDQIQLIVKTK